MKIEVGKRYKYYKTIIEITEKAGKRYYFNVVKGSDDGLLFFDENSRYAEELVPVNECIVVYRKDSKVIALDKTTGKTGIAKCSPDDEFNFETGAKLAFERLTGKNISEPDNEFGAMASALKGMVTAFEESGFTRPEAIRITLGLANGKSDTEGK